MERHLLAGAGVVLRDKLTAGQAAFTLWTEEELRSLLKRVEDDRLAALWRLAIATGADGRSCSA